MEASAPGDETVERPTGKAEQTQFLTCRRIDCQPVSILGVPLRAAHFIGIAIAPDRAFAQKPMRGQPRAREQGGRPPRVSGKQGGAGDAADHLHHPVGDEIHGDRKRRPGHSAVELARHGKVAGERWVLEVAHAWRTNAGLGQAVVKPCGGAVAEVSAERLMNRAEHLKQDEDRAGERERNGERPDVLDGADQHAHRDGEGGRGDPSQN